MSFLLEMNWLAILACAIVSMVIGAIYYSPKVMGTKWMNELGYTEEDLKNSSNPMMYVGSVILAIVGAIVLSYIIVATGTYGWMGGLKMGVILGLGIAGSSVATNHIFEGHSMTYTNIVLLHYLVYYAAAGAIIGALG